MDPTRRQRVAIGLLVGSSWIGALVVVAPLIGGFALDPAAEAVIVRSPGWLSTMTIGLFGFYAKSVLLGTLVVGCLALTTLVAVVWPGPFDRASLVVLIGGTGATGMLFWALGTGVTLRIILAFGVAVAVPFLVARLLTTPPRVANRRWFLRRVGGVVGIGTLSLGGLRLGFSRIAVPQESERVEEPLERSVAPPQGDPAFDVAGMPAAVTSPEDHYVVDITVRNPTIDPDGWRLAVDGAVEQPYTLSYDELLAHEARVEQTTTMVCISNQVGGDLIGTAHWTGVQLSDLVETAVPTSRAVDVVTHAADGYSEAIPIDLVEREDILVAYGMGDRTLATEHGFPARLLIPGRYGMKMTKWLTHIEVVESAHEAYWEARGWDEQAIVNTMSYVRGFDRFGDRAVVGGVAFAGLETGVEEIAGVEVSVDGGDTWTDAELEPQLDVHAWRRWKYEFPVTDETEIEVVCRAVERDGTVQTGEETSPRPSGATGWHRKTFDL